MGVGKVAEVRPVDPPKPTSWIRQWPILEILLRIQLQGGNNLADLTPEIVWVEKLGMFLSKHGTVHHYLAFSIGLPYPSYVFRVFQ